MKRMIMIAPVVMFMAFAMVPYVRRRVLPRSTTAVVVIGSRDRNLHGKARIRARRGL